MAKRKSQKKATPKEEFFVGISQPDHIHISLLESKRTVLQSLKLFNEIKKVKQQKNDQQRELRRNLRAVSSSMSSLISVLPSVKLDPEEHHVEKKVIVTKAKKVSSPKPQKEPVDELEKQLNDIEAKLAALQH